MKVRPGRAAGRSHPPDGLADPYRLPDLDLDLGQMAVAGRDAVAVLDLASEELVWAARGPWIAQHDPSLLEDGNILLFDNLGNHQSGNASRVLEIDPRTLGVAWRYTGTPDSPFASIIRSSAQRLPNGNTLITESDGGRLFEVTRDGRKVWEYLNPVRAGAEDSRIAVVQWGQRIDPAERHTFILQ